MKTPAARLRSSTSPLLAPTLALLALAACGGDDPPSPGPVADADFPRELLFAAPDRLMAQVGKLEADLETRWGGYAINGWQTEAQEHPDGTPFVWTRLTTALLRLPAAAPTDRELVLRAWAPEREDAEGPCVVTLSLNGRAVGNLTLGPEPTDHRLEVKAPVWTHGENLLALEVEELGRDAAGAHAGLAVASVEYGPTLDATPDLERGSLVLESGAGAAYWVEADTASELRLEGRVVGNARLAVEFTSIDSETGMRPPSDDPPLRVQPEGDWLFAEMPLPSSAGEPLEIQLVCEGDPGARVELTSFRLRDERYPQRPPIVFISIDTLAARHLSVYGYQRETSPNLTALAAEGIVFERCSTNSSWTLPSYLSVISGLLPSSHRISVDLEKGQKSEMYERWRLAESRWTLTESLHAAGYRAGGFVDSPWLLTLYGFEQGFDHYDVSAAEIHHEDPEGGVRHVVPLALEWIDEQPEAPLFVFLQALDPHGPYMPDDPWKGKFESTRSREPFAWSGVMKHTYGGAPEVVTRSFVEPGEPMPEKLSVPAIVGAYDEEILLTDAALGELFDALKERGLFEDAIVVVHADHGETFNEHQRFDHGTLYEDVALVPLIVRLPGGAHAGTRVAQSVQSVDIYPTLLDYLGLGGERGWAHGRSLMPLIRGEELPPVATYCELGIQQQSSIELEGWKLLEVFPNENTNVHTMMTSPYLPADWRAEHLPELAHGALTEPVFDAIKVRLGDEFQPLVQEMKRLLEGPVYELYYLPDDPGELTNLADERNDVVEALKKELRKKHLLIGETQEKASESSSSVVLSDEQLGVLDALGYIDAEKQP